VPHLVSVGALIPCAANPEYLVAPAQLVPVDINAGLPGGKPLDLVIAGDWTCENLVDEWGRVMAVGRDSFSLMSCAPKASSPIRLLDVCCGSGLQGLAVAARCDANRVVALDVNPRCVHFARVNAMLNMLDDRIDVRCCDLYCGLAPGERFDAIYANPPFAPSPIEMLPLIAYRNGGPDGTGILRRILQDAGAFLCDGGFLLVVAELPNVERCPLFLGSSAFQNLHDLHLFHNPAQHWTVAEYARECQSEFACGPGVDAWEAALRDAGIVDLASTLLFAQRSAEDKAASPIVHLHPLHGDGDDFLGVEEDPEQIRAALQHLLETPSSERGLGAPAPNTARKRSCADL